jgi:hypothetical protein
MFHEGELMRAEFPGQAETGGQSVSATGARTALSVRAFQTNGTAGNSSQKAHCGAGRQERNCGMLSGLKRSWHEIKKGRPGCRFQARAEKRRRGRSDRSWFRRFAEPVVAIILLAVGLFFCLVPGPGLPFVILGAAMLSERSLTIARALDWTEVKVRKVISLSRVWWMRAPVRKKVGAVVVGLLALGGAGFGAYAATFGR